MLAANGWRYEIVGEFGALHYQGTINFDASDAVCTTTLTPMFYTACYVQAFLIMHFYKLTI